MDASTDNKTDSNSDTDSSIDILSDHEEDLIMLDSKKSDGFVKISKWKDKLSLNVKNEQGFNNEINNSKEPLYAGNLFTENFEDNPLKNVNIRKYSNEISLNDNHENIEINGNDINDFNFNYKLKIDDDKLDKSNNGNLFSEENIVINENIEKCDFTINQANINTNEENNIWNKIENKFIESNFSINTLNELISVNRDFYDVSVNNLNTNTIKAEIIVDTNIEKCYNNINNERVDPVENNLILNTSAASLNYINSLEIQSKNKCIEDEMKTVICEHFVNKENSYGDNNNFFSTINSKDKFDRADSFINLNIFEKDLVDQSILDNKNDKIMNIPKIDNQNLLNIFENCDDKLNQIDTKYNIDNFKMKDIKNSINKSNEFDEGLNEINDELKNENINNQLDLNKIIKNNVFNLEDDNNISFCAIDNDKHINSNIFDKMIGLSITSFLTFIRKYLLNSFLSWFFIGLITGFLMKGYFDQLILNKENLISENSLFISNLTDEFKILHEKSNVVLLEKLIINMSQLLNAKEEKYITNLNMGKIKNKMLKRKINKYNNILKHINASLANNQNSSYNNQQALVNIMHRLQNKTLQLHGNITRSIKKINNEIKTKIDFLNKCNILNFKEIDNKEKIVNILTLNQVINNESDNNERESTIKVSESVNKLNTTTYSKNLEKDVSIDKIKYNNVNNNIDKNKSSNGMDKKKLFNNKFPVKNRKKNKKENSKDDKYKLNKDNPGPLQKLAKGLETTFNSFTSKFSSIASNIKNNYKNELDNYQNLFSHYSKKIINTFNENNDKEEENKFNGKFKSKNFFKYFLGKLEDSYKEISKKVSSIYDDKINPGFSNHFTKFFTSFNEYLGKSKESLSKITMDFYENYLNDKKLQKEVTKLIKSIKSILNKKEFERYSNDIKKWFSCQNLWWSMFINLTNKRCSLIDFENLNTCDKSLFSDWQKNYFIPFKTCNFKKEKQNENPYYQDDNFHQNRDTHKSYQNSVNLEFDDSIKLNENQEYLYGNEKYIDYNCDTNYFKSSSTNEENDSSIYCAFNNIDSFKSYSYDNALRNSNDLNTYRNLNSLEDDLRSGKNIDLDKTELQNSKYKSVESNEETNNNWYWSKMDRLKVDDSSWYPWMMDKSATNFESLLAREENNNWYLKRMNRKKKDDLWYLWMINRSANKKLN